MTTRPRSAIVPRVTFRAVLCSASLLLALGGCSSSGGTGAQSSGGSSARGGTQQSGGTKGSGGVSSSGGAQASGGVQSSGGVQGSGGAQSSGGKTGSGGSSATGGQASGGVTGAGGVTGNGGAPAKGGSGAGGTPASGGASGTGGVTSAGGTTAKGGAGGASSGGATGSGGTTGAGGTNTNTGTPPGDIANASGVSVVAAHSMTRALFATYSGKLFKVTRLSDKATKDISVTSAGGTVDLATLTAFCTSNTACGISVLYDQTGNGNDLSQTLTAKMPTVGIDWKTKGGVTLPYSLSQASGDDGGIPGGGGQFLRNRLHTKKIPTGSQPTTEYMVVYAKYYKGHCCWDYGNMEATPYDPEGLGNDGAGTMFALYFGQTRDWTTGAGMGPWGMVDMEIGVFSGGESNGGTNSKDPSFTYPATNVVGILAKTNGTSAFTLKVADMEAASTWTTPYSGNLPAGYAPLRLEGGLSLGEGGDGSNNVDGAFFEGFVVAGQENDATDSSIATNLHDYFTK